jgi:hypothetical protein
MNWHVWGEIEQLLVQQDVCPILAVVPDNQDPILMVEPPIPNFWDRVRAWQARGWTIALHGYQHVYVNKERGLIGVTPNSEFAGISRQVQEEKLRCGLDIFSREGVRPDCWVAPSHSFDWTTVSLLSGLGIKIISDGLWPWPHTDENGIIWVPQQFASTIRPMRYGVWTMCNHHNCWSKSQIDHFRETLKAFGPNIIGLNEAIIVAKGRSLTVSDRYHAGRNLLWKYHLRPFLVRLLKQHLCEHIWKRRRTM